MNLRFHREKRKKKQSTRSVESAWSAMYRVCDLGWRHSEAGRFAYKSIRIQGIHRGRFADTTLVDSHTSKSIRLHWKKKRSHKHSNRIAIGQRNKLNLNPAICACCYYVSCVIFDCTANALTARRLSSSLIQVYGRFATIKSFRYNSTVDLLHICCRFATHSLKT